MEILAFFALLVVGAIAFAKLRAQAYRRKLLEKYGDERVVDMIIHQMMWQGMSSEQLRDSLGAPAAIDREIHKTKTAETYKYHQAGRDRFRCRVKLENDVVVGWEQK